MFTYVTHTFNLRSLCSREATSHCKWTCDGWQVLSCQVSVKQEGPSSWPEQQTNIIEGPGATANLKWELRRGPSCSWAVPCGFLEESCGDLSLWTKTLHFNFMRSMSMDLIMGTSSTWTGWSGSISMCQGESCGQTMEWRSKAHTFNFPRRIRERESTMKGKNSVDVNQLKGSLIGWSYASIVR